MPSEEPVAKNAVSTGSSENNGNESTEKSPVANDSTEPEPEKLPEESPNCPVNDGPLEGDKKADNPEQVGREDEYEPVPENWDGFVVLDEAEITESEGGEDDDDEDAATMQWDCAPELRAPRTYTNAQLEPTELDPRCKPGWSLAGYWPVYFGNFRLYGKFASEYHCCHAMRRYLASKGLPSFMVFLVRDTFHDEYQKRVGFYDMLVYFISKEDASRAVEFCHRDLYYGHRLNVYDGRTPDMFPVATSYRFKHKKVEDQLETESKLESYLKRHGNVVCIAKHDFVSVLVQYSEPLPPLETIKEPLMEPCLLDKSVQKQRFVEQDVEQQLAEKIAENPKFLTWRLNYKLLLPIKHGVIPELERPWMNAEDDAPVAESRREFQRRAKRSPVERRHDLWHGPALKSSRQLTREARSLEHQLRSIRTEINVRRSAPAKDTIIPSKPMAAAQTTNPEAAPKPKRHISEHRRERQRKRGKRRNRSNYFRERSARKLRAMLANENNL